MAVSPIIQNFAAGYNVGSQMGEGYRARKANKAMGDLAAFDPTAPAQAQPQQGGYQPQGGDRGMTAGMPGQEASTDTPGTPQVEGQAKLPSTREWTELRARALKTAAGQGPEHLKAVQDKIDSIQQEGFTKNMAIARQLSEQGRSEEMGTYLERAYSFKPDFGVLHTSPATMRDGSKGTMAMVMDEQTGEPRAPAMMATPEVIDKMAEIGMDPAKFFAGNADRKLNDRKMQLQEKQFGAQEAQRGWTREKDQARFDFDVDKEMYSRKPKKTVYKAKDYDDAVNARLKDFVRDDPKTMMPVNLLSGDQIQEIRLRVSQARQRGMLAGQDPDYIASYIINRVRKGAQ